MRKEAEMTKTQNAIVIMHPSPKLKEAIAKAREQKAQRRQRTNIAQPGKYDVVITL